MTKFNVDMEAVLSAEEIGTVQRAGVPYYFVSSWRLAVPALVELFEGVQWRL